MTKDGHVEGTRLRTRGRSLRVSAEAVRQTLASDRLLQASLALAALFTGLLLLPVLSGELRQAVVGWVGPAVFALLIPYAFLHGELTKGRAIEDAFWRDLVLAAWSALAAVVLRRLSIALDWDPALIISRLALVVAYTLVVVAVERQPHRDSMDSRRVEMRLTLPTILLLVVGLIFYFVLLPVLAIHGAGSELSRMSQILTALGILLVVRVGYLAVVTESPRWRTLYGILSLLGASVVLLHGRRLPVVADRLGDPGMAGALLWLPAMLLAVLLARVRHHNFPADRYSELDLVTRLSDHPAGLAMRTMFVALAVPVIHFGAYRFGLFDPAFEQTREAWVFFWILGLGAVAVFQNRRLSGQLTSAFRERRRIENALANTERSLRLADARRQSEEAVWSKKEKYVKAFRYSPDAMLLTTVVGGRLLEFNNRFLEILGYRRDEVTDRTVFDIDLWADPDQRDVMAQTLRTHGQVRNLEIQIRTREGDLRWVSVSAELLEVGGESCIFAVARDITAREESLSALQRQAALLDQARDAVAVIDRDDVVTYGNAAAARILALSPDELRGRTMAEALGHPRSGEVEAASRKTRESGVWRGPLEMGDGESLDAFWSLVTDAEGAASAKLVFLRSEGSGDGEHGPGDE